MAVSVILRASNQLQKAYVLFLLVFLVETLFAAHFVLRIWQEVKNCLLVVYKEGFKLEEFWFYIVEICISIELT